MRLLRCVFVLLGVVVQPRSAATAANSIVKDITDEKYREVLGTTAVSGTKTPTLRTACGTEAWAVPGVLMCVRVFACARARANMYVYGGHSRSQVCVTERGCARERMHVRMQFGAALVQFIFVLSFSFIYSFDLFDHWRLLVHHLFFICSFQHSKETPDNEGPRSHIFRKSVWHPPGHHADIKCMVDSTTGATETFAKHRTYEGHACLFFWPKVRAASVPPTGPGRFHLLHTKWDAALRSLGVGAQTWIKAFVTGGVPS